MRKTHILILILFFWAHVGFGLSSSFEVSLSYTKSVTIKVLLAPPTITCPSNVTAACPHDVPSLTPTTFDDNGVVLQTYTLTGATTGSSPSTGINDASSELFLAGITTVTYYIEDAEANSDTCSFTVNVTDTEAPLIICPDDIITTNDSGFCYATINNLGFSTAYDSCSGINITRTGIPAGNAYPAGTTTVTWTVTDAAGNSTSCTQDVTVTDEEPPTIVCSSDITLNTDPGQCQANVTIPLPTTSDNCAIASITNDFNGGGADASDIYPVGTTIVTYVITDSSGYTNTCSLAVTVVNNENPEITLIGANPLTLEACSTYTELGATASDACFGDLSGSIIIDTSNLNLNAVGTYNVTYNVSNSSGTFATEVIRTVNIIDTTTPILSLIGPNPISIGDCSTYTELGAIVDDGCLGNLTANLVIDNSSIDTSTLGTYTVTYNATDNSGNVAAQITRTVTVVDVTPPDIVLIGDNPVILEACDPYVDPGATAIDPCFYIDYTGNLVIDTSTLDNTVLGTYQVSYDVMDAEGNIADQMIRDVEVVDTTIPVITLNGANPQIIEACDMYTELGAIANDYCFGDLTGTIIIDASSIDNTVLGTYNVTYDVTDINGNVANQIIRTVEVVDTSIPTVLCQNITIQLDPTTGIATITPTDIDNGSFDNCPLNLVISTSNFDCSHIGDNIVTLSATDIGGNSSSCDAIVTVTDLSENATVTISASTIEICQNEPVNFTATTANAGTPTYQWQINNVDVPGETGATFSTTNLTDGDEVTVLITSGLSICAQPIVSNSIFISVSAYNPPANAGPNLFNNVCTDTTVSLAGNAATGTGVTTLWTVTSGQPSGFSFSDATSPTSTFTGDVGETYTLMWSIDNPDPCPDSSDTMMVTFIGCNALDFDGVDDNITFRDNYNFNSDFSIEVWMKSEVSSGAIQTIFSKREANNLLDGYDLRVVNDIVSFNWNNGQSLASPFPIQINKWHHIAVTFGSGTYTLYIDGVEMNTASGSAPIINIVDCILGAMDQTIAIPFTPLNYFNGTIDELRIWDTELAVQQIRAMMNQEVEDNSGNTNGSVVALDIESLLWNDLYGYYQMNQSTDIVAGDLLSNGNSGINGRLRYMTTLQAESAPLPYQSITNGSFFNSNTWRYGNVQNIPYSTSINGTTQIEWNIVRTSHDITSGNNDIVLYGLDIDSNTLSIEHTDPSDGQSLRITDYLNINGTLLLVGESQLLQDVNSIVDYTGTGTLKRDQQGTANLYNYNYWSSPVGNTNTTYTLEDILYDGSQPVLWTSGQDANPSTTPITMSNRWLYTYENFPTNSYADWQSINENNSITVGLGFLMKGSGTTNTNQNYTFVGQPNNGTISTPITANYDALVGNPYPSALDSHEFISDNSSSIQGTVYFWEHYTSNTTHVLEDYEGGYAAYNFSGGNPAVSPPEISGLGISLKIPERYIPVGQGFFVQAGTSNGQVTFENDQRIFVKEAVTGAADNGSVFMRTAQNENTSIPNQDLIRRLRIHFKTPENAVRPLLLAFTPNNEASEDFDYGYDAINNESFPNDMSWLINNQAYVIQGVGDFDATKMYPLALFISTSGPIKIGLDRLENFESEIDVYVYDALTNTSFQINNSQFTMELENNNYLNRFFITFQPASTLSVSDHVNTEPTLMYLNDTKEIYIKLPPQLNAKSVSLFNTIGQEVHKWTIPDLERINDEIRLKSVFISEGIYVVKLTTSDNQVTSKKMIIKY